MDTTLKAGCSLSSIQSIATTKTRLQSYKFMLEAEGKCLYKAISFSSLAVHKLKT